jgi:hypothetical protein
MALFYGLQMEPVTITSGVKDVVVKENSNSIGHVYIPEVVSAQATAQQVTSEMQKYNNFVSEQFKGVVQKEQGMILKDVGEPLPYNMNVEMLQGIYSNVGFVTGAVDKYIDFIISPGMYVKSKDIRAQTIIEEFMQNVGFDGVLRGWTRDALIGGNAYMELAGNGTDTIKKLKVLNPKTMYVKRNDYGGVIGFTQYFGLGVNASGVYNNQVEPVKFEPEEIAHFGFNKIGDCAYGIGLIYPALTFIDNILKATKDMHKIISRKANSQIHVKMGDPATGRVPTPEVINSFGQKMQYMNEKTEWVTDCYVDMKVLDFGNVADKFDGVLRNDFDMIFFTFQVPEVLMGRGNIPEGLASVQMEAFQRRIQSIQAEISKIVEEKIFKKVLASHGIDAHVDLFFGEQSDTDRRAEIDKLTTILQNPMISTVLRNNIENRLMLLLKFVDTVEDVKKEKKREMNTPLPNVPGQNKTVAREKVFRGIYVNEE